MGSTEGRPSGDPVDVGLDRLFAAYRNALPDPEASAGFMPGVWRAIETRRAVPASLRQLAQSFITAAAGICLCLTIFLVRPAASTPVFTAASYVEVLASDPEPELVAYAEISHDDPDSEEVVQ